MAGCYSLAGVDGKKNQKVGKEKKRIRFMYGKESKTNMKVTREYQRRV
jgi:hypothetical protein